MVIPASTAYAAGPFTVNSTADASDVSQGDGRCAASNGACTLRAAIQEASSSTSGTTVNLPVRQLCAQQRAGSAARTAEPQPRWGAGAGGTVISRVEAVQPCSTSAALRPACRSAASPSPVARAWWAAASSSIKASPSASPTPCFDANNASGSASQGGGMYIYGASRARPTLRSPESTVSNNTRSAGRRHRQLVPVEPHHRRQHHHQQRGGRAVRRGHSQQRHAHHDELQRHRQLRRVRQHRRVARVVAASTPATRRRPQAGQVSYFTMNGGALLNNSLPLNLLSSGGGLYNATAGVATLSGCRAGRATRRSMAAAS